MRFRLVYFLCFTVLLVACTQDDVSPNESLPIDLSFFSFQHDSIFQSDIMTTTDNITVKNLTSEASLADYSWFSSESGIATFFRFNWRERNFRTTIIDFDQGVTEVIPETCSIGENEFVEWIGKKNNIITLISSRYNGDDLEKFVTAYDIGTQECNKSMISTGTVPSDRPERQIIFADNHLITYHRSLSGDYILMKTNLTSLVSEVVLSSPVNFKATTYANQVHVFLLNQSYEVYDLSSNAMLSRSNLDVSLVNSNYNTLFETSIQENNMLIDVSLAQPSPVPYSPGLYNLHSGELEPTSFNMINLNYMLTEEQDSYSSITTYKVDLSNNIIAIGFERMVENNELGGILLTNFDGEILEIIETTYIPHIIQLHQ